MTVRSVPQDVIRSVLEMPLDFRRLGTVSMLDLLRRSGYFDHRSALSVEVLMDYLATHPALIHGWLLESDDQRTDRGWYFTRDQAGCTVGYFPGDRVERFPDCTEACATFVHRHLADMARPISSVRMTVEYAQWVVRNLYWLAYAPRVVALTLNAFWRRLRGRS